MNFISNHFPKKGSETTSLMTINNSEESTSHGISPNFMQLIIQELGIQSKIMLFRGEIHGLASIIPPAHSITLIRENGKIAGMVIISWKHHNKTPKEEDIKTIKYIKNSSIFGLKVISYQRVESSKGQFLKITNNEKEVLSNWDNSVDLFEDSKSDKDEIQLSWKKVEKQWKARQILFVEEIEGIEPQKEIVTQIIGVVRLGMIQLPPIPEKIYLSTSKISPHFKKKNRLLPDEKRVFESVLKDINNSLAKTRATQVR